MKIRRRLILVFTILLLSSYLIFWVKAVQQSDQKELLSKMSLQQLQLLEQMIDKRISVLKKNLSRTVSYYERTKNFQGPFLWAGRLESVGGSWKAKWLQKKGSSTSVQQNQINDLILQSVQYQNALTDLTHVKIVRGPRKSLALVVSPVSERSLMVGLFDPVQLLDLTIPFKGGISKPVVLDSEGGILSSVSADWIGKLKTNHPFVQKVVKSSSDSYQLSFDEDGHSFLGFAHRVFRTNVYAAMIFPKSEAFGLGWDLQVILTALAFILIAWFFANEINWGVNLPLRELENVTAKMLSDKWTDLDGLSRSKGLRRIVKNLSRLQRKLKNAPRTMITDEREELKEEEKNVEVVRKEQRIRKEETVNEALASLAHQLIGPIEAVLGHSQKALEKKRMSDMAKGLQEIEKETFRIKGLVDQVSSQVTAENQLEKLDMRDLVELSLRQLEGRLQQNSIEIVRVFEEVPWIDGLSARLQAMIVEVLKNAIEAMRDSKQKTLTLKLYANERYLTLAIADTGVGISEDSMKHIFTPMFSHFGLNGLGLSTVLSTVRLHKGDVRVQSLVGEGTEFFILLPVQGIDLLVDSNAKTDDSVEVSDSTDENTVLSSVREIDTEQISKMVDRLVEEGGHESAVSEHTSTPVDTEALKQTIDDIIAVKEKKPSQEAEEDFKVKIRKPKTRD